MLSVYIRHHPDCKNAADKTWRRCNCPKWIWGSLDGKFIRQSARTHLWEEAEELRLRLSQGEPAAFLPARLAEAGTSPALPPLLAQAQSNGEILPASPKRPRISVKKAVEAYLADAVTQPMWEFHGDLRLVSAAYYAGDRGIALEQLNYPNPDVVAYVQEVRRRYMLRKYPLTRRSRRSFP